MTINVIKIIGTVSAVIGIGSGLVSSWVEDKKMDDKIAKAVKEALTKGKES